MEKESSMGKRMDGDEGMEYIQVWKDDDRMDKGWKRNAGERKVDYYDEHNFSRYYTS
jgi:hypothetical protein